MTQVLASLVECYLPSYRSGCSCWLMLWLCSCWLSLWLYSCWLSLWLYKLLAVALAV